MAVVERDDQIRAQAIREGGNGGIGAPQWEIGVLLDVIRDGRPVFRAGCLDLEIDQLEPV